MESTAAPSLPDISALTVKLTEEQDSGDWWWDRTGLGSGGNVSVALSNVQLTPVSSQTSQLGIATFIALTCVGICQSTGNW